MGKPSAIARYSRMLQQCGERFFGYMKQGQLAGVISYERTKTAVHICRLMVDPGFFRQGIVSALSKFVCHKERDACNITVMTGSANTPALCFYMNATVSAKSNE